MEIDAAEGEMLARTIRAGSKSFDMAALLLPKRHRLAARALYAFCRSSDDAVDEISHHGRATAALRRRLELIYAGRPEAALEDRAFALVAHHHRIPFEIPSALIEGFEWDEDGRRYETLEDLLEYAARVAATVGVMMSLVMARRDRHVLARAAELGLAMQLTNIARDVGEDARRGRIYLPLSWMREAGLDAAAFLDDPRPSPQLASVVSRLLDCAGTLYESSAAGVPGLPFACRPAIGSAALIYRAIGGEIARNRFDSVSRRATTSLARKLALVATGTLAGVSPGRVGQDPPRPSVRFLVDCAARPERELPPPATTIGRFIEILGSLEAREREMTSLARTRAGR